MCVKDPQNMLIEVLEYATNHAFICEYALYIEYNI